MYKMQRKPWKCLKSGQAMIVYIHDKIPQPVMLSGDFRGIKQGDEQGD